MKLDGIIDFIEQYFEYFKFNGESSFDIQSVNNIALPKDYLMFMKEHNGGEGSVGESAYLMLYRLEELQEINDDYNVEEFLPEHCFIGSSGGGESYGVDKDGNFFAVPDIPMSLEEKIILGNTFFDFIKNLEDYL